jgi:hypothetical protein
MRTLSSTSGDLMNPSANAGAAAASSAIADKIMRTHLPV